MNSKVFVCFDDDGNIEEICLDERACDFTGEYPCGEFIMKLIPIKREHVIDTGDFRKTIKTLEKSSEDFGRKMKKEVKEIEKSIKKLKLR
jgi:protein associated with RNAse G/E